MPVKNAAFLALVGLALLTLLTLADLIQTVSGVMRGILPALAVFRSLIYAFASLTATIFVWAVYKRE
jgi:hypothetical protein